MLTAICLLFAVLFVQTDADYNDWEDIALWQNQRNVRHITVRGTFHAGGFFARGHLAMARRFMPHIEGMLFDNCSDLHTDRLQEVVDSHLSPLVVVQSCGASSSAARAAAAAAAAAAQAEAAEHHQAPGSGGGGHAAAAALVNNAVGAQEDSSETGTMGSDDGASSSNSSSAAGAAGAGSSSSSAGGGDGEDSVSMDVEVGLNLSEPQLVSQVLVEHMAVAAAAAGVQLKWVDCPELWRVWLDGSAAWQ